MVTTTKQQTNANGQASTSQQSDLLDHLETSTASALDLTSQIKQAHWVVTGPNFIALHELFDTQATEMRRHVDAFAERARQLGGVPHGTIRQAAERTQLQDFPAETSGEREVVETLVDRYASFAACLEAGAAAAEEANDRATEDLYVEVMRAVNLQRWFLESHFNGR